MLLSTPTTVNMKICILLSSYDDTGSVYQEFDEYQDPGVYVKSHQFEKRLITAENANQQIDRIVEEGFDYIWNFLCGTHQDNVAGISATEYLESKNVPTLGISSKYLAMTKVDFKKCFKLANVKTPNGITLAGDEDPIEKIASNDGLNFPLIIKQVNGSGSEHMSADSVCQDLTQLVKQVEVLKWKTKWEILIEEFIVGEEMSIMVLETKDGVIALTPIVYGFPEQLKDTEKFFDFDKKFRGIDSGEITYKLFNGDLDTLERIKEESVKAYIALGVLGSGYARIDLRLKNGVPYFLEVNNTPAFFSYIGNTFGDDFVIETTFPGGHEAFVDTIISSRIRFDTINKVYSGLSSTYADLAITFGQEIYEIWEDLSAKYDFSGTVLDLGCGAGYLGNILKQKHRSTLTGIDMCSDMTKFAKNYEQLHVGLIENVMLELDVTYDHIISSGTLFFCCKQNVEHIFARMFSLATTSITLTVEDLTDEYISKCQEICNHTYSCYNHTKTVDNLPVPYDWKLVHKKREYLWKSPIANILVYGFVYRYEKF